MNQYNAQIIKKGQIIFNYHPVNLFIYEPPNYMYLKSWNGTFNIKFIDKDIFSAGDRCQLTLNDGRKGAFIIIYIEQLKDNIRIEFEGTGALA